MIVLAGALTGVVLVNHSDSNSTPPMVSVSSKNVLTVTGADVDQAATDQAISDLENGTAGPLLDSLPMQVKREIVSGQRKFHRLPPQVDHGDSAFQPGDKISLDFNGINFGTYDLSKPLAIDLPLKIGDQVGIHCRGLAPGKASLTVDLATVQYPVKTHPLMLEQSQRLTVQQGPAGKNYEWFEQEARAGNAVAQYGLGHMYQFGLGVDTDREQAIHWYQLAAAQNYLDAKAQLQLLQSNP